MMMATSLLANIQRKEEVFNDVDMSGDGYRVCIFICILILVDFNGMSTSLGLFYA